MTIDRLPYRNMDILIKQNLSTVEHDKALRAIAALRSCKARGFLTKTDLRMVAKWKAPRAIRHIERNTPAMVKKLTSEAFATTNEKAKLEILDKLKGVSVPMASAILMLTDPKRYPVIDIRTWQILHIMGEVAENTKGTGLRSSQWETYLSIVRHYAKKYKVTARDIDRTLFQAHLNQQVGNLYS
jgi:multidrug efflux pump subunit AcrB